MKILYVTTVGLTMTFFVDHIKLLQSQGHVVELACNIDEPIVKRVSDLNCTVHHIPFSRNPLHKNNFKSFFVIKNLLKTNKYDIVHVHTPNASVITRLVARKFRMNGTKVVYTAHGFHFYKGAPLINWLIYYPVEKFCSRYTDVLITINKEDYALAQKKMNAKQVKYISGIGIDVAKFRDMQTDREAKRKELGLSSGDIMLLSVGELNRNKNHQAIIRAIAMIKDARIHYYIAGTGELESHLLSLAQELKIEKQVHLLGFRSDIPKLLKTVDVFCMPSFREGLPVSLMEAMASGLPCIVSDIRGNVDLIEAEQGGFLVKPTEIDEFSIAIKKLVERPELCARMSKYNIEAVKNFDTENISKKMKRLYSEVRK